MGMYRKTEVRPQLALNLWPDTGQALGLSRNATYQAAAAGEIPTIRIGRLLRVPAWFHREMLLGEQRPKPGEAA
jgi:hypothetical protein